MHTINNQRLDIRLIDGVFAEATVWSLLRSLLLQLQGIHQTGQVLQNLQPEMIFQRAAGQFELTVVDIPPSPEYAAPEQLQGQRLAASDIYSLGLICLQGLTGIAPFELWDATTDQWSWRLYLQEEVSPQLAAILDKMVQRSVADRYANVAEILAELGFRHLVKAPRREANWKCTQTLNGHRQTVTDLVCHWPTYRLYSASEDKSIGIWDLQTGRLVEKLLHHRRSVTSLALHPSGQFLAAASDDRTISIWDLAQNRIIQSLEGHTQAVKSLQFLPDGEALVSASWDKSICFWDWRSSKSLLTLTGHRLKIGAIDVSTDGRLLASGSHDRSARIWDIATGRTLHILEGHEWAVTTVAFSPNHQWLATGSDDHTIKIWHVETGDLVQTLPGHSWDIGCLQWRNEDQLISGSWNPAIKIWDRQSAQAQQVKAHDDFITSVLLNGNTAITGSGDRTIKLWLTAMASSSLATPSSPVN